MPTNKTSDVLLRYRVDSASVNAVRASFGALEMRIDDLRAELTGVGTSAQRGVSGLRQQFRTASADAERLQDDLEDVRRAAQSVGQVDATPKTGGGGGAGGGLNTLDRLGTIGSQIAGGFGSSEIGNVAGLIGDVAGGIGTLGVVGGAAALAVGAVSLALGDLQRAAEAAKAATEAQIAGDRAAAAQAGTSLTGRTARMEEILGLISFEEQSIAARKAEITFNDLTYATVQASNAAGQTQVNLVQLGNALTASSDAARASIDASETAISELAAEFQGLSEQVAPLLRDGAALRDLFGALGGAFEPLVAPVQNVVSSVTGLFSIGRAVAPVIGHINDGLARMRDEARAAADQLQTQKADSYLNAITQTVTAQEALGKAQAAYNEAVAASQARISEINANLQADLSEAEAERQRDLADAAREAGEARVRAEEQRSAEIARIQKRFDRSFADAVGERDALAAKRAEDQRDSELEQLDDRYKDQLRAADDGLKAQQRLIEQRYTQQVQTVRAAADAALRLESQRAQAEINLRQQAVQAAQVQLVNALNAEATIRANYYNQSISQAQAWANLMQLYTSYGLSVGTVTTVGTSTPYFTGNTTTNPYIGYQGGRADGGPVTAGGAYLVGERGPELIVPRQSGTVIPNGAAMNMNINLAGATTETIKVVSRQQAIATFDRVLRSMGVA